jgi:flagellar biosynthesis protein FlhF
MSASGLQQSIAQQTDKDVILIDTAGRSPNHVMHMGELEEFMIAVRPDLTLLVMSATTNPQEQSLVLERFRPLSTHLILTKLDESRCEGAVLDLVTRTDLPLTYVTNGQNVPDDIDVATPEKLMNWILGEGAVNYHIRGGGPDDRSVWAAQNDEAADEDVYRQYKGQPSAG